MKNLFLLFAFSVQLFAATGSWNGVAFTHWNGVAQTAWNGTAVSCASAAASFADNFNRADSNPMSTTSSSGGTWVNGPGALVDTKIVSNQNDRTADSSGSVVSSPTFAANHYAEWAWGTGNSANNSRGGC